MAYKDPLRQKDFQKKWYLKNKDRLTQSSKQTREKRRQKVREMKSVPCMDCGKKYPYYVMDFDHRDCFEKKNGIGYLLNKSSWETVLEEIKKCDIVCSNCHRERSWSRGDYYKNH